MKFMLNRDRTLASVTGRTIEFKKGELTHVPPAMHAEAIAIGAIPEHELEDDEKPKVKAPEGEERAGLLKMALEDMVAMNNREDFTAAGLPNVKVVMAKTGFEVTKKEVEAAWNALKQGTD